MYKHFAGLKFTSFHNEMKNGLIRFIPETLADEAQSASMKVASSSLILLIDYLLSTRWAVPSGQKTFSPIQTLVKRRLHSKSCLSQPSQSRDNILTPHHCSRYLKY